MSVQPIANFTGRDPDGERRPPVREATRWAFSRLLERGSAPGVRPRTNVAGDMATVARFLQVAHGLPPAEALGMASAEVANRRDLTPSSTKKNRSEARAILEFGLGDPAAGGSPAQDQPLDLLLDISAQVSRLRMADIRKLRSSRLRGAKGGRPGANAMRVLEMVRRLRARAGTDRQSAREFEAIRQEFARQS